MPTNFQKNTLNNKDLEIMNKVGTGNESTESEYNYISKKQQQIDQYVQMKQKNYWMLIVIRAVKNY